MKPFETSLPMVLYHTLDVVMPPFRAIFARFGLTEQQWRVLRVLWEQDGKPLLALAGKTLIQAPSLVGVVDRLQRDGLVERRRSRQDRRVVRVCLTRRGQALKAQVTPLVDAAYSQLEGALSPGERAELLAILRRIARRAGSANGDFGPGSAPDTESRIDD